MDIRRRWLGRLAFSFLIIGMFLFWEAYKGMSGQRPGMAQWRIVLYMVSGALSLGLGVAGIRERHRSE